MSPLMTTLPVGREHDRRSRSPDRSGAGTRRRIRRAWAKTVVAIAVPASTSSIDQTEAQHPVSLLPSGDQAGQNPFPTSWSVSVSMSYTRMLERIAAECLDRRGDGRSGLETRQGPRRRWPRRRPYRVHEGRCHPGRTTISSRYGTPLRLPTKAIHSPSGENVGCQNDGLSVGSPSLSIRTDEPSAAAITSASSVPMRAAKASSRPSGDQPMYSSPIAMAPSTGDGRRRPPSSSCATLDAMWAR